MSKIQELKTKLEELENEYAAVDNQQYALKILMNAFYGCFSNVHFRFYDIRMAAAVTSCGQMCIRGPSYYLNQKFPEAVIVYNDTDSIFVELKDIVAKRFKDQEVSNEKIREFVKKISNTALNTLVKEYYEKMTTHLNTPRNTFDMDFEAISDKTLFIAKKKYITNLVYKDGYDVDLTGETPLKTKGVEIVRTSTPQVIRNELKKLVRLVIESNDNEKCIKFLKKFRITFNKLSFEDVAFPRGINGLNNYKLGDKSVPIHVRASLIYNKALEELNLTKYPAIQQGEKIKFAYIKTPNSFGSNVIACLGNMPEEIRERVDIDYDLQFEKAFLAPTKNIFNTLDWITDNSTSMAGTL